MKLNLYSIRTADGRIVESGFSSKMEAKARRKQLETNGKSYYITKGKDHWRTKK